MSLLNECIPLFETLRDPHRQAILVTLVAGGPLTVNEVAASSTLSRPAVSHHLGLLARAGLIEITKVGTRRMCEARTGFALDLLTRLVGALESDISGAQRCRAESPESAG
ncbi:ArsR/SmtB family transcription factor [Gordonia sp. NPDC003376]